MMSGLHDNSTLSGSGLPPEAARRRVGPVAHVIRATGHSFKGFRGAFASEMAFRLDLLLFVVLTPVGIWFGKTGVERALLVGSLFIVLITELLNSGIEKAIDRISYKHHPLSGLAKDFGSAAVFCSLANLVAVWLLVFFG
ncbi:MAG TPA: diacylglycerol kinase [Gammaproteobacteria bacterium]|nr:diacylglycerol kinase [Gammaproteobacteria bacterium]